ncbi:MAG TPA: DUF2336 domain-containing protein [Geobacterales bacterium]|nr:DUF2336 domain-containing protein [Geobacterales bacterium]
MVSLIMAWSPVRRFNAGRFEVHHPGDYANLNSYQLRDGTREHPEITTQIQTSVADVTGELHSIFGPASKNYFCAKKAVSELHRYGNLHEKTVFEYAQSHKLQEVTIALSLLCSLPANVIERGLIDSTGEMPMIFAKALEFSWETMMSLLFLGAPNYKISARDLDALKVKFSHLTVETAKNLIRLYQSRKATSD